VKSVHNEIRKREINQRLLFLAFFAVLLFFDAMVGSNSSWGQAPLIDRRAHLDA